MSGKVRSSNFELLRIFCLFGIIFMHSFGEVLGTVRGLNLVVAVFENALFNTCVSCLMLISGYFGMRFNVKRLIQLDLIFLFYSIAGTVCQFASGAALSKADWFWTFFPVVSGHNWFISGYFCLAVLSPFINRIPERMSRDDYRRLLLVCTLILSIVPTVFLIGDTITGDAGKGVANMLLIYLIGRYIRLYRDEKYDQKKLLAAACGAVLVTFFLNMALSLVRGVCTGNFARDCSVTVIVSAVFIFLYFKQLTIQSSAVNFLAGHVMAVIVLEGTVRMLLSPYFSLSDYADRWYLGPAAIGYVLVVMGICLVVNTVRMYTVGRAEPFIENLGEKIFYGIIARLTSFFNML